MAAPADALEIVLYYLDGNEPKDIVHQTVEPNGLSSTQLQDFSVALPTVRAEDAWAGKTIGVAIRAAGKAGGFWDLDNVRLAESMPVSIPIENASFEAPAIDPNGFPAVPLADKWLETRSRHGGQLQHRRVPQYRPSAARIAWSTPRGANWPFSARRRAMPWNRIWPLVYKIGCSYRLTVAVGVSVRFPPSSIEPVDTLEIVLYYLAEDKPVDIVHQTVEAKGLSSTQLQDFSVYLSAVQLVMPGQARPSAWRSVRSARPAGSGIWTVFASPNRCR